MAYEMRENSGSLFKNDRKEKDTHPDYTGQGLIGGQEYWISAWLKEAGGKKFFSFAFKPKEDRPQKRQSGGNTPDLDDEIPF